jgi:nickel transport protein
MGHKNDFIIPATHIRKMVSASFGTSSEDLERSAVSVALIKDPCQLETMIEETMDRKLAAVIQLIRDTRKQGPTITEILGGIGYIFGLFGVAIYINNRKKRKQ